MAFDFKDLPESLQNKYLYLKSFTNMMETFRRLESNLSAEEEINYRNTYERNFKRAFEAMENL